MKRSQDKTLMEQLQQRIDSDDMVVRHKKSPNSPGIDLVYMRTMVDPQRLVQEVLQPIEWAMTEGAIERDPRLILPHRHLTIELNAVSKAVLRGSIALFRSGSDDAVLVSCAQLTTREIGEPSTEIQLMGPKIAFIESLDKNINMLRTMVSTHRLRIKEFTVGRLTESRVAVVYLAGITAPDLVKKMTDGIAKIDVDTVRGMNDLQEIIVGRSLTPFPLAQRTERPDLVTNALSDGRIAVIVEGAPWAMLVPTTLAELQSNGESFLGNPISASFVRGLRYVGLGLALMAPPVYAAVLAVNPEVLPSEILSTIATTRVGVPYPVLLEVVLMLLILDVVKEATIQSPSQIAQTLTVAGSLIIGQAAVQAHLASQLMVITLAVTAIGTLLTIHIPLAYAVRLLRYPLTILGGVFGIYGLALGAIVISIHLASLKSFDTPYLAPYAPAHLRDLRWYSLFLGNKATRRLRPATYGAVDQTRTGPQGKDGGKS